LNAVWSYEKIKDFSFAPAEIDVFIASVLLWKHTYPQFKTYFICDAETKKYFSRHLNIFDEVIEKQFSKEINKEIFWAAAKIESLKCIPAPVCHIDLDFYNWINLEPYGIFDYDMVASFEEETERFYLNKEDAMRGVKLDVDITGRAFNTSFMFFKSEWIKDYFCDTAISYMEQASKQDLYPIFNSNKSLYMIFAEQQLFGEVAEKNNIRVKTLVKEKFLAGSGGYVTHTNENGILKESYAEHFLVHLGEYKKNLKDIKIVKGVNNHINRLFLDRKIKYNRLQWLKLLKMRLKAVMGMR